MLNIPREIFPDRFTCNYRKITGAFSEYSRIAAERRRSVERSRISATNEGKDSRQSSGGMLMKFHP